MSKTLTIVERTEYNLLTKRIKGWYGDSFAIASALELVREKKLYRDDHKTFDAYIENEIGVKRSRAYQLLDANQIKKSLGKMSTKLDNTAQALALKNVPEEKRVEVIEAAEEPITAKSLLAAAKEIAKPAPAKKVKVEVVVVRDSDGFAIPDPALPAWNRRDEMKELTQVIRSARTRIRALDQNDPMLVEVNLQSVLSDLTRAMREFECSVPNHVCGVCQGQAPKTCLLCKGRGVISDFRWISVPEEVKAMRAPSCKK